MAVVNLKSSLITTLDSPGKVVPVGELGASVRVAMATITTSTDDATSTYDMVRIPSNAHIVDGYVQYGANFAGATAAIDVGVIGASITDDPDILLDGVDIVSAAGRTSLFADAAGVATIPNQTKPLWELLGATSDPNALLDVRITLVTANLTTGDSLKLVVQYAVD